MAIANIREYAHLTEDDVEAIGREFDAIRREVEFSRGERDAHYIRTVIQFQRGLEISGRTVLFASFFPPAWLAGVVLLGASKIIENLEIGHNVMHGQWDWMNDPEIHSSSWEWDNTGVAKYWKHTHNLVHHKYTNVLGLDDDIGFGLLRVTRDQRWRPFNLGNPVYNLLLAMLFEYGVAIQHLELGKVAKGRVDPEEFSRKRREVLVKVGRQLNKDYLVFPLLTGPFFLSTLTANLAANIVRNVWSSAVVMCGHFPDGAEKFTKTDVDNETRGEWYLRQMLGSANISGSKLTHFMAGNISHQIEHHLFPDLPSNRLAGIAVQVRELCDKYDLPYTSGSLPVQYFKAWRTLVKLSLPDRFLRRSTDDAPETASERRFDHPMPYVDPITGRRRGLRTALLSRRSGFRVRHTY